MGTAQVANTFIGSEVKPFSQDRSDGPSEPAVPQTPSLVWLPDMGQLGEHATRALCSHALLLVSVNLQKPQTATRSRVLTILRAGQQECLSLHLWPIAGVLGNHSWSIDAYLTHI